MMGESATALPADVLGRDDVRAALAVQDFGQVFYLARKWAGISYSRIAAACEIKPERVGILARGQGRITSYEKIVTIADALRIPGGMVGIAARPWETSARLSNNQEWPDGPANHDDGDRVKRRQFLKTSALSGISALTGLPDLNQFAISGRVSADLPDHLRRRAARLRRLDDVLGGGDTFAMYLGEFESTRKLLKTASYSTAVGDQLLSVMAEQAQQAGWAAFDSGAHQQAVQLYETSLSAANQAGDLALAGNALAFLAYERIGTDPAGAVQMATAACETAGPSVRGTAGALLQERRAWANAIAGNAAETDSALAMALETLASGDVATGPDWSAWVDHDEIKIMTGRCWTELRRPLRAVPVLKDVLAGFDDSHARDKALYMSWLAASYLHAGEVEESAATVSRALDLAQGVASVRPRQQLAPVLTELSHYKELDPVRDVLVKART